MTSTETITIALEPQKGRLAINAQDYPGLDPAWIEMWNEHGGGDMVRADEVTLEEYRKSPARYGFSYPTWAGPAVHRVQDIRIPVTHPTGEITIRVYSPAGPGPFPVHLNFHGGGWHNFDSPYSLFGGPGADLQEGGWVLGGLQSEAAWCRHMCNMANIIVIDVDYRMGPEYKYPAAIYDCWDAVKWTIANAETLNANSQSVSFGGLSAGGHMSAVLAHFARDEGVDIKLHLMIVPATDMRYCSPKLKTLDSANCPYESARSLRDLPWSPLTREQWFLKYWLGEDADEQERILNEWICTPMLAPNFKNLPPAHIVTAEFDLERDEGEAYGIKMLAAGNQVTMKRYEGVPHAFAHYNHPQRGLAKSFEFIEDTAVLLRSVHYGL